MSLDTAQASVSRHISENGSLTHGALLAKLASTQRRHLVPVIADLTARRSVRVEDTPRYGSAGPSRVYTWIGSPPDPVEVVPFGEHGDPDTYMATHHRLRRKRGYARNFPCFNECGRQANQWSYMHNDPDEVTGPTKTGRTDDRAYSVNLEFYEPLCYWCHVRLDNPGVG